MRRLSAAVLVAILAASLVAAPALARDSLGVFGQWGAFRDPQVPRCYAIASANAGAGAQGYASVSHWPARQVRGQVHFRLSRAIAPGTRVTLVVGEQSFTLTAAARNGWADGVEADAAIVSAMRAATTMQLHGQDRQGHEFTDSYRLDGAATAIDAADVACPGR